MSRNTLGFLFDVTFLNEVLIFDTLVLTKVFSIRTRNLTTSTSGKQKIPYERKKKEEKFLLNLKDDACVIFVLKTVFNCEFVDKERNSYKNVAKLKVFLEII